MITAITAVFLGFCVYAYVRIPVLSVQIFAVGIGILMTGILVYVCFRRIQEIKKEDPDDLSKY